MIFKVFHVAVGDCPGSLVIDRVGTTVTYTIALRGPIKVTDKIQKLTIGGGVCKDIHFLIWQETNPVCDVCPAHAMLSRIGRWTCIEHRTYDTISCCMPRSYWSNIRPPFMCVYTTLLDWLPRPDGNAAPLDRTAVEDTNGPWKACISVVVPDDATQLTVLGGAAEEFTVLPGNGPVRIYLCGVGKKRPQVYCRGKRIPSQVTFYKK